MIIIKITNLGMPNVYGRHIKKAAEAFRAGTATAADVYRAHQEVLRANSGFQSSLDLRPVFDTDLVDRTLKTAVMFGLVPRRFGEPGQVAESLDSYLSMLWGKKGISSVAMLKWYGSNYHYAQPEFEREPKLTKDFVSPLIEPGTKPALVGPWTMVSLGANKTRYKPQALFGLLAVEYSKLINSLPEGTIVQIEEPSFLTHGVPELYNVFLGMLKRPVHLHTYYGPANGYAQRLFDLKVDGIGLDFVEGPENLELLREFPRGKDLIAGIINAKSGQPADGTTRRTLDEILNHIPEDRLWLSPSAPLLHVRLTAEGIGLHGVRSYAVEKLKELDDLRSGTFRAPAGIAKKEVQLPTERYGRIIGTKYKLPEPFLTSHIGSFPQIGDLRKARADYNRGIMSEAGYKAYVAIMIQEIVRVQQQLGIKAPVTGEYDRDDMVAFFARGWNGYQTPKGDVQSYGVLYVSPPVIVGDISADKSVALEWIQKAQEVAPEIKATLTGPVTMVLWAERRFDIPLYLQFYQAAEAVRTEIRALVNAGIKHIQVDEPALGEGMPLLSSRRNEYIHHATNAFRLATMDIPPEVSLWSHLCFTQFNGDLLQAISGLEADVIAIENSRSGGKNARFLYDNGYDGAVAVGTFDVHSTRVRPAKEIVRDIEALLRLRVSPYSISLVPDCGQKATPSTQFMTQRQIAEAQLEQMVRAAEILKGKI